jgi:hypothetical protein
LPADAANAGERVQRALRALSPAGPTPAVDRRRRNARSLSFSPRRGSSSATSPKTRPSVALRPPGSPLADPSRSRPDSKT